MDGGTERHIGEAIKTKENKDGSAVLMNTGHGDDKQPLLQQSSHATKKFIRRILGKFRHMCVFIKSNGINQDRKCQPDRRENQFRHPQCDRVYCFGEVFLMAPGSLLKCKNSLQRYLRMMLHAHLQSLPELSENIDFVTRSIESYSLQTSASYQWYGGRSTVSQVLELWVTSSREQRTTHMKINVSR